MKLAFEGFLFLYPIHCSVNPIELEQNASTGTAFIRVYSGAFVVELNGGCGRLLEKQIPVT